MRLFLLQTALPQMDIFDLLNLVLTRLTVVAVAVLLVGLAVKYVVVPQLPGSKGKPKTKSKAKATGVIFGKSGLGLVCSPEDQEGHIGVFGGAGLGKTTALLVPTLQRWKGTAFVIDIAGDVCGNVEMPQKLIFEPGNPQSSPYNIFATVDAAATVEEKDELLQQLAHLIMPDAPKDNDTTAFFKTEGRKMLTAALICYYHQGIDFVAICEKIIEKAYLPLLSDIKDQGNPKAYRFISGFQGTSEQNTAGCKQVLDKAVILFATNEKLKKALRRPYRNEIAVSPAQLERYSVFVVLDDSKLKVYAPLLNIITAQCMEYMSTRANGSQPPILFCLDEFASLGKMEITDALRKLRKKRVRIMMLTQSMADLDLIYGRDERMAMMNNFAFKAVLGCDDTDTQEYFSRLIGEKTVIRKSISTNDRTKTQTESEYTERIIPPAELARLGQYLVLLSPGGYLKLKKNYFYRR